MEVSFLQLSVLYIKLSGPLCDDLQAKYIEFTSNNLLGGHNMIHPQSNA